MRLNAQAKSATALSLAVALAASRADALTIIPTYTQNVTSLSNALQIETAFSYAAQQYEGMFANDMTIYITVDTGSSGNNLGNSNTANQNSTYADIRNALIANAFTNIQISNVNYNWPANDPTGNNSTWKLANAQAKAIGLLARNNTAVDGTFTFNVSDSFTFDPFARTISGQYDFIGTAEHEISEIMGRYTGGFGTLVNGKSQYAPFNLARYTANGVRSFNPTQAGVYFSPDGGFSNLKTFNNIAPYDATDWATTVPYSPDSFNANSNPSIANTLTPVDETVMETLGYIPESNTLGWSSGNGDFLLSSHWFTSSQGANKPHHGANLGQNSLNSVASHIFTANENFILADNSDMGQTLTVTTGLFNMSGSGPVTPSSYSLLVNQNGQLTVNSTGSLHIASDLSVGDDASATAASATVTDFANVTVGTFAGASHSLVVGNFGLGTFNQSGSSTVNTGNLTIGGNSTGSGIYFLSGTATLNVSENEYVGLAGGGVLDQSSGNHTVTGTLYVGTINSASLGRFEIDAGNLTVGALNVLSTDSGGFLQTGGTVKVNGALSVLPGSFHSAHYSLTGGSLSAASASIDYNGNFTQSNGSFTITNDLSVGVNYLANFTLSNGSLNAGSITVGTFGYFSMSNGSLNSTLTSSGNFTYSGGTFFARLVNKGNAYINADFAPSFGMENDTYVDVPTLRTFTFNGLLGSLDNEGNITLEGTITGSGPKLNNGDIEFKGTISGSGQFTNAGTLNQTFSCILGLSGTPYYNTGTINLDVPLGHFFFINTPNSPSADRLINTGTINFVTGSTISGSGGLENAVGGIINASQSGFIQTAYFLNEGTISIPAGTFHITLGFSNLGTISLTDANATLTGGSIANNGLIIGFGTINNIGISGNRGAVEASGGTLTVSSSILLLAAGTLQPDAGATLLLTGNYTNNTAHINLNGGTLDNNNQPLTNQNLISGFGTLNTALLTNGLIVGGNIHEGSMNLSGGDTIINSHVNNVTSLSVTNGNLTINGTLYGNGTVSPTSATVTIAGDFTGKTYASTNSLNIFQGNVIIPAGGAMSGGAGDQFQFNGAVFNNIGTFTNDGILASNAPIQNVGTLTQNGTLLQAADFNNTGTVSISGPQTWSADTNYINNAGNTSFVSDTGFGTPFALSVTLNAGNIYFFATQHLAALAINSGGVSVVAGNIKTYALTLAGSTDNWTGVLDIQSNKIIVEDSATHAASLANFQNQVAFAQIGPAGITSSTLPVNFAIAVIDNAVTNFSTFGGEPVDANSILISPELLGDANADGIVNITDLNTLLQNFGTPTLAWTSGNFDNAPTIDLTDLADVLNNFGLTNPNATATSVPTPEPTSLAVLGLGAVALRRRRNA